MGDYVYPALQHWVGGTHPYIRLVNLLRDDSSMGYIGIHCQLVSHMLFPEDSESYSSYEALSYSWGDTNEQRAPTEVIWMDGRQYLVSPTLFSALCKLRRKNHDRLLWIDALCINQLDLAKRSSQVQRMRQIYTQAKSVVAWMGEGNAHTDYAMDLLASRFKRSQRPAWLKVFPTCTTLPYPEDSALMELLSKSWFHRVWVVQEAASSRRLALMCGEKIIDGRCLTILPKLSEGGFLGHRLQELIRTLTPFLELMWSSIDKVYGAVELLELLHRFRSWQSSDPRDKVYALLGLTTSDIQPDYSLPVSKVYEQVVQHAITYRSLRILTHCNLLQTGDTGIELPSWCPDWSRPLELSASQSLKSYGVKGQKGLDPELGMLFPSSLVRSNGKLRQQESSSESRMIFLFKVMSLASVFLTTEVYAFAVFRSVELSHTPIKSYR